MTIAFRRDSFCGKMSACNNLTQYGIPYSLTTLHTVSPGLGWFPQRSAWFAAVCRVVNGFADLRVGSIGARPAAFNTVRYSEKILESQGITMETVDLSEILGRIARLKDDDADVQTKLDEIRRYVTTEGIPPEALMKMAKLGAVIEGWMQQTDVTISAVQCWTAMEEYFGVVPCTIMSMMSNNLIPSACEVDICGTLGMHALRLASGDAQRAARLEQQLRRRSQQGRLLPLQQPAQAFLSGCADGLPGDHRGHGRQGEHIRHLSSAG